MVWHFHRQVKQITQSTHITVITIRRKQEGIKILQKLNALLQYLAVNPIKCLFLVRQNIYKVGATLDFTHSLLTDRNKVQLRVVKANKKHCKGEIHLEYLKKLGLKEMNTVRKHLSMINKNVFQKAMIKITWGEEMKLTKEKHLQVIIDTLLSQNEKISCEEGMKIIMEYVQSVDTKKWQKSLKTLMLVHHLLNVIQHKIVPQISSCISTYNAQVQQQTMHQKGDNNQDQQSINNAKQIHDGRSDNMSDKRSGSIPKANSKLTNGANKIPLNTSSSHQQIDVVHSMLVQKYYQYIFIYNERLEYINALSEKKISSLREFVQEWLKIKTLLVLFSNVQSFMRELESSLSNFKKVEVTQRIACLLSSNLQQTYYILKHIVSLVQTQYKEFENPTDFTRFFSLYSDFITATKHMSKFNLLRLQLTQQFSNDFKPVELYVINKELNRDIELYNLNVKSMKRVTNLRFGQMGNDFISLGVSTQIEEIPYVITKENNFTRSEIFPNKAQSMKSENENSIFNQTGFQYNKNNNRPISAKVNSQQHTLESHLKGFFALPNEKEGSSEKDQSPQSGDNQQMHAKCKIIFFFFNF